MKIAIYSRKSKFTGKGDSVENQVQMCKEYIKRNFSNKSFEFEVFEDEGFSGGNINRPEFKRLLKDIKNKKFNILICYRLDRISRNVSDFSSTLELLQQYNVDFISVKEQFDTSSPMGRAMVYISSVFAQLERETIAERVRDNMLELAKSGRWLGGQTPLGFESEQITYIDTDYKERSMYKLSPIKNELKLVKIIYDKYYELKSLRQVNQWLLENRYKTKLGSDWNVRSLSDLLQNPTYVKTNSKVFEFLQNKGITCIGKPDKKHGILTYNKKKGQKQYRDTEEWIAAMAKHEGIIEPDKWLEIQNTLKENKSKAPKLGKTHNALLTGLMRCAKCGSPMTILHGSKDKNGNKRFYYACSMKISSKGTRCDNGNINSIEVEKIIINKLKESIKNETTFIKTLKSIKNSTTIDNKDEITQLNKDLKEHELSIENLVKQISENSNSVAAKYLFAEIEKREIEIQNINKKILELQNTSKDLNSMNFDIDLILESANDFYNKIDSVEFEYKKYLISNLIEKINWDSSTGELDIQIWGSKKK